VSTTDTVLLTLVSTLRTNSTRKFKILHQTLYPVCLPSVYLTKLHVTKSPRSSPSVFAYCKTGGGDNEYARLITNVLLQVEESILCHGWVPKLFHVDRWKSLSQLKTSSLSGSIVHATWAWWGWSHVYHYAYMHHSAHCGHVANLYITRSNKWNEKQHHSLQVPTSEHAGVQTQGYCHLSFIPHVTHFADCNSVPIAPCH